MTSLKKSGVYFLIYKVIRHSIIVHIVHSHVPFLPEVVLDPLRDDIIQGCKKKNLTSEQQK